MILKASVDERSGTKELAATKGHLSTNRRAVEGNRAVEDRSREVSLSDDTATVEPGLAYEACSSEIARPETARAEVELDERRVTEVEVDRARAVRVLLHPLPTKGEAKKHSGAAVRIGARLVAQAPHAGARGGHGAQPLALERGPSAQGSRPSGAVIDRTPGEPGRT